MHINVIPDLDDDEFADELLVGFTLRRPRPLEFALPKIEFIPASGVEAYEAWLRERMVPTPVYDDVGDPVVDDDGQPKTTPREPISDKELMLKQVEVALMALARDHKSIISVAKAKQVIERLDAGSIGQVRWVYNRWKEGSESSMGESGASTDSSAGSTGGPSDTTSSPADSIPAA